MTGTDCEQQSIDFSWSLTRKNACHLAVQNQEMGELRDEMISMREDISGKVNGIQNDIANMQYVQNINIWIWGIIASTLIVMAIKKVFAEQPKTIS